MGFGSTVPKYRQPAPAANISSPSPYASPFDIEDDDPNSEASATSAVFGVPEKTLNVPVLLGHAPPPVSLSARSRNTRGWGRIPPTGQPVEKGVPFGRAVQALYQMSSDDVATLQDRLKAGGFYGPKDTDGPDSRGVADDATLSAYKRALARTAGYGGRKGLLDVLDDAEASTILQSGSAKQKQPLSIVLTNPKELRVTAEAVARQVIGRKLKPDEMTHFIDSFHSMQAASQRRAYEIDTGAEAEGTFLAAPKPEDFAISQLREEHPQDADTVEYESAATTFHNLLKGANS